MGSASGDRSREFDLPGDVRIIKKIDFRVSDLDARDGKTPKVEIWGRDVSPGGLLELGERRVAGKLDKDVLNVGESQGAFTALGFKAEQDNVRIYNIEIVLADNSTVTIGQDFTLQRNQHRFVDLPGSLHTSYSAT